MRIELTRFRVQAGKEEKVQEWMDFLKTNMEAVKETLEPEEMYVETIFSEELEGVTYLYWYSVQGEPGQEQKVTESPHWLDQKHVEYWRQCIDPSYPPQDLTPMVHMLPDRVLAAMRPLG